MSPDPAMTEEQSPFAHRFPREIIVSELKRFIDQYGKGPTCAELASSISHTTGVRCSKVAIHGHFKRLERDGIITRTSQEQSFGGWHRNRSIRIVESEINDVSRETCGDENEKARAD